MSAMSPAISLPCRAGVGLKAAHIATILATNADVGWFEIHAENYMGAGGRPHHDLVAIAERYPLSIHGVGLSIGSAESLDQAHLGRLRTLLDRYQPAMFSEHLAWSSHEGCYLNDLLPVPYTFETLERVAAHIDQVQEVLKRQMLLENPSTYVALKGDMSETEFLRAVAQRTGCGLLLDVNNVHVSAINRGEDAGAYLAAFPLELVKEIHLGGHAADQQHDMGTLLIDAHDREVDDAVWSLYAATLQRAGPLPTLIEWDNAVPAFEALFAEAVRAEQLIEQCRSRSGHARAC